MRATYGEYYSPSSHELREFMETAIVVPDANVLLGLYELSSAEREQLLDLLEGVSDQLWLAYQAGLEYQRNRMGVIRKQSSSYERARALHGASTEETLREYLDNLSLPEDVHNEIRPLLAGLVARIADAVAPYDEAVSDIAARHVVSPSDALSADPVRARLDAIFKGRVEWSQIPRSRRRESWKESAARRNRFRLDIRTRPKTRRRIRLATTSCGLNSSNSQAQTHRRTASFSS